MDDATKNTSDGSGSKSELSDGDKRTSAVSADDGEQVSGRTIPPRGDIETEMEQTNRVVPPDAASPPEFQSEARNLEIIEDLETDNEPGQIDASLGRSVDLIEDTNVSNIAANDDFPNSEDGPTDEDELSDDLDEEVDEWEKRDDIQGSNGWFRRSILIGVSVILVGVLAFGMVVWRLSQGPVQIERLETHIRQNLLTQLPQDLIADFEKAEISIDPLRGLVATIRSPKLESRAGDLEIAGNSVSLGIGLWSAIAGEMRIHDIEIDQPILDLRTSDASDRSLTQFDFAGTRSNAQLPTPLLRVGQGIGRVHDAVSLLMSLSRDRGLTQITVIDGEANFVRGRSSAREYRQLNATISAQSEEHKLVVAASGLARGGAWRFSADAEPDLEGRGHIVEARLDDVAITEFFPALGRENFAVRTNVPVSVSMRSRYLNENENPTAKIDFSLGSAYVFIGERDLALMDNGSVSLIWSPELNAVSIEESVFNFGPTRIPFSGFIRPSANNPVNEVEFRVVSRQANLAPRDNGSVPAVQPELIGLNGRLDMANRFLNVDRFEMRVDQTRLLGTGTSNFQTKYPSIAGAWSVGQLRSETLKQIWPPTIMAGPRRWFIKNVKTGLVDKADLTLSVPPGLIGNRDPQKVFPPGSLEGKVLFSNAVVQTFGDLPELRAPSGQMTINEDGLLLSMENGNARAPTGIDVSVPSALFRMPVLGPRNPSAEVTISMIGAATDLAAVADADPINFMTKLGVPPDKVKGDAVAEVTSSFEISSQIDPSQVQTQSIVRLSDFSSAVPIQERLITDGELVLESQSDGTRIRGSANLDGIPADVNLFVPAAGSEASSQTDIQISLSEEQRRNLGIDLGEILAGPTPVRVGEADASGRRLFEVDLTQARLTLSSAGWSKGAGVPALLKFFLVETSSGRRLEDIEISGEGFAANGSAVISSEGGLQRLQLSELALRPGDSISVDMQRTSTDSYTISIVGDQFDARGIVRELKENTGDNSDAGGTSYVIDAKIARLMGFNNQYVSGARVSLQTSGGLPSALSFEGQQIASNGRVSPVTAQIEGGNGSSWLSFSSTNGGQTLGFLDFTNGVQGGQLAVSASLGRGGAATVGQASLTNFRVGESDSLDQLAQSVQNNRTGARPLVRTFEQARMDFTIRRGQVAIDDAYLRGPAMGVTLNGSVDTTASRLLLNGVYVPAYGLNNAFSKIPIFGPIIGGDRDQGLLGVTFRVSGSVSEPLLTVNPISAIAPGVFRRIFEFR